MKYGIATVVGLTILGAVGAWFYNRSEETPVAEEPVTDPQPEPTQEEA
jgi:hypothetical protein